MRLGKIQQIIVDHLAQCSDVGGYFGASTKCSGLWGYDLAQVQRALEGLIRRGIVRKEGPLPRHILVKR